MFKHMLTLCGLDHQEAADHLGCSLSSIRNYSCGRTPPAESVVAELRHLYALISHASAGNGVAGSMPGHAAEIVKAMQALRR